MAGPAEIAALLAELPAFPFAQLRIKGAELALIYEGRTVARLVLEETGRPAAWSANQAINALAHAALYGGDLSRLPPAEGLNAAHQIVEWWDSAVFAIARLGRVRH